MALLEIARLTKEIDRIKLMALTDRDLGAVVQAVSTLASYGPGAASAIRVSSS